MFSIFNSNKACNKQKKKKKLKKIHASVAQS